MSVRVLVVDDQPVFRAGLMAILGAQPDIVVVGQAADGAEALSRSRALSPDVVLMDVRMPTMDGIEATRRLTRPGDDRPVPKVVVLTTFDADEYVFAAIEAGASGFLLKDSGVADIATAVEVVSRGEALLAPQVTRSLIEGFVARRPGRLVPATVFDGLTDREREVFLLVARGRTNAEIAGALYMAEQTAKSHVSRILTKLNLRDRVHAVMLGYETGLVTPGRP